MPFTLHEYQYDALRFALAAFDSSAHGCGLFLEPGLGKTATSIAIMDCWKAVHPDARFLVIAPSLVAKNSWPAELEAWKGNHRLDWALALGDARKRRKAVDMGATVTVINQENVAWLDRTVKKWPWTAVVVDEISGFKNTKSGRTRALRRRRKNMDWCLGLTGTPATRSLLDLYGEIALIDNGATFGSSFTRFRDKWFKETRFINTGWGRQAVDWEPLPGARNQLLRMIEPFCLSMSASDKLPGLPDMLFTDHWLEMPQDTRAIYRELQRDMVAEIGGQEVTAASAGVLTAKLAQASCGGLYPDPDDPDGVTLHLDDVKLDELARIIESTDDNVLIFYQFAFELDRMRARFPGLREIHEKNVVDDWNNGRIRLLAAHPAAAKFGLNIQKGAHTMVWTSLPWSYDDFRQACDRLHRQGQHTTVTVHRLLESNTVDARKLNVLQGRENLHEAVMGALAADD